MRNITKWVICKVLAWDKTVTREESKAILDVVFDIRECETIRPLAALRMLGCSRPTLRRYVNKGWIREIKISHANRFYDKKDIERLIRFGPPKG